MCCGGISRVRTWRCGRTSSAGARPGRIASRQVGRLRARSALFADATRSRAIEHRLRNETLMLNELYLAVLYRPIAGAAPGLAVTIARKVAAARGCVRSSRTRSMPARSWRRHWLPHSPATSRSSWVLSARRRSGARRCSSISGLLINGEWQRMPLPRGPLNQALASARLFFGTEAIEYRSPTETRVGAMLGIKEYPTPTVVGMYNRLLVGAVVFRSHAVLHFSDQGRRTVAAAAPVQSHGERRRFRGVAGGGTQGRPRRAHQQRVRHGRSSFFSASRRRRSGTERSSGAEAGRLKALNDQASRWRAASSPIPGMLVAREDLALEAAFWAQLPGNFPFRPRKAPITSRNLAAMAPFHNYPAGRANGNHWGEALTLARDQREIALLLFAACERSQRSRRRQPQGYGTYAHLRSHGLGQNGLHRLFDRPAGPPGRDSGDFRQGSRPRDSGARVWAATISRSRMASRRASIPCSCRRRRPMSNSSRCGCAS